MGRPCVRTGGSDGISPCQTSCTGRGIASSRWAAEDLLPRGRGRHVAGAAHAADFRRRPTCSATSLIPALADQLYHVVAPDLRASVSPRRRSGRSSGTPSIILPRRHRPVHDSGWARLLCHLRFRLRRTGWLPPRGVTFERITAIISQNGNAYEEGLSEGWNPIQRYWKEPTSKNRGPRSVTSSHPRRPGGSTWRARRVIGRAEAVRSIRHCSRPASQRQSARPVRSITPAMLRCTQSSRNTSVPPAVARGMG